MQEAVAGKSGVKPGKQSVKLGKRGVKPGRSSVKCGINVENQQKTCKKGLECEKRSSGTV